MPLADSLIDSDMPDSYKPVSLVSQLDALGHLSDQETVGITTCIVQALSALHQAGLLHGDATPFNILRVHDEWILGDPGLVRFLGQPGITRNRMYYPDPRAARPCDDLYAAALTMWDLSSGIWEMASGKERLRVDDRLLSFLSRVEQPMSKFICRALSQNAEQRYLNAGDMLRDLRWLSCKIAADPAGQSTLYERLRQLRGGLPPLE
jgi:serine/threonine protein kinase